MSKFERLKERLARRPDVYDPGGLAAHIGREKYGEKVMEEKAEEGREHHEGEGEHKE